MSEPTESRLQTAGTGVAAMLAEARLALSFLTRLPVAPRGPPPAGRFARCYLWFPPVGALIGAAAWCPFAAAIALGLPPLVAAALTVAFQVLLTGALHEDGLADVADGLAGGRDRERKLAIMRDSRIGTYGVTALTLMLVLRIATLAALTAPLPALLALITAGGLAKAVMPLIVAALPAARSDGVAAREGRPSTGRCWAIALLGGTAAIPIVAVWPVHAAPIAVLAAGLAAAVPAWLARRQIGGYTGDVLGAAEQGAHLAVLLALVATV